MKLHTMALLMMALLPLAAGAADAPGKDTRAAQRKGPRGTDRPDSDKGERERHGRPGQGDDAIDGGKLEEFFQKHSPNRWAAYQKLPPDQKQKVRGLLVQRYRGIQFLLRTGNEDLLKLRHEQIRVEDEIFKLRQEFMADGADKDALKTEMRKKAGEWVDDRLKEREERIKRLKAMLDEEARLLEADRGKKEQLVDKWLEDEVSGDGAELPLDRPRRTRTTAPK